MAEGCLCVGEGDRGGGEDVHIAGGLKWGVVIFLRACFIAFTINLSSAESRVLLPYYDTCNVGIVNIAIYLIEILQFL